MACASRVSRTGSKVRCDISLWRILGDLAAFDAGRSLAIRCGSRTTRVPLLLPVGRDTADQRIWLFRGGGVSMLHHYIALDERGSFATSARTAKHRKNSHERLCARCSIQPNLGVQVCDATWERFEDHLRPLLRLRFQGPERIQSTASRFDDATCADPNFVLATSVAAIGLRLTRQRTARGSGGASSAATSSDTTLLRPAIRPSAASTGVLPSASLTFGSAPFASKCSTTFAQPFFAAPYSAVCPLRSVTALGCRPTFAVRLLSSVILALMSAPAARNMSMSSIARACACCVDSGR